MSPATVVAPSRLLAPPGPRAPDLQLSTNPGNGGSLCLMNSKACPSCAVLCLCAHGCPQASGPCTPASALGGAGGKAPSSPRPLKNGRGPCLPGTSRACWLSAARKCLPAQQGGRSGGSLPSLCSRPEATTNQSPCHEMPLSCTPGVPGSGVCPRGCSQDSPSVSQDTTAWPSLSLLPAHFQRFLVVLLVCDTNEL